MAEKIGVIIVPETEEEFNEQYSYLENMPRFFRNILIERLKPKIQFQLQGTPIPLVGLCCPLPLKNVAKKNTLVKQKIQQTLLLASEYGIEQVIVTGKQASEVRNRIEEKNWLVEPSALYGEFLKVKIIEKIIKEYQYNSTQSKVAVIGIPQYFINEIFELLGCSFGRISVCGKWDVELEKINSRLFYNEGISLEVNEKPEAVVNDADFIVILNDSIIKANLQESFKENRVIYDTIGINQFPEFSKHPKDSLVKGAVIRLSPCWKGGITCRYPRNFLPGNLVVQLLFIGGKYLSDIVQYSSINQLFDEMGFEIWDIQIS